MLDNIHMPPVDQEDPPQNEILRHLKSIDDSLQTIRITVIVLLALLVLLACAGGFAYLVVAKPTL
jgi:hypothetical protein